MFRAVREYIFQVCKAWLKLLAGPIAAVFGLLFLIIGSVWNVNPTVTRLVTLGSVAVAALLIPVAQYEAWKTEWSLRHELQRKNTKPDIRGEAHITDMEKHLIRTDDFLVGTLVRLDVFLCNHTDSRTNVTDVEVSSLGETRFANLSKADVPFTEVQVEPRSVVFERGISFLFFGTVTFDFPFGTITPESLKVVAIDGLGGRHNIEVKTKSA